MNAYGSREVRIKKLKRLPEYEYDLESLKSTEVKPKRSKRVDSAKQKKRKVDSEDKYEVERLKRKGSEDQCKVVDDQCKVVDGVIEIFDDDDHRDKYEVTGLSTTDSEDVVKSVDGVVKISDDDDERDYGDGIKDKDEGDCNDDNGFEEDDQDGCLNDTDDDHLEKRYKVLIEEDIRRQQQEDITLASNTLSISTVSATILLRHYNWDVDEAHEAWFTNEEKVRKDVGLLEEVVPIQNTETIIKCNVCFDDFARDDMSAATCGHFFCKSCWTQYISMKINDGPGCLMLRCPYPSCPAAVGQDMVNEFVSDEDKEKYSNYLYRSYVEDKRNMSKSKWCPGPGCECAIAFIAGSSNYDVVCGCGHMFCWNCIEDAHRPVDCDTVHKWVLKNSAESENVSWILANSKSCPKCKKPIQKNEGCMHMTCTCGFHFCWLCLGDWKKHGEKTGGFYACNIYEKVRSEGDYDEIKNKAKDYLDKYAFYYERFEENQKSRIKAIESLKNAQSESLPKLSKKYCLPEPELVNVTDAWIQIIECRRVLKWTYAYGYYIPPSEHVKKQFFECLQGEAESALERLHRCAERDLPRYLGEDNYDLTELKGKLVNLTGTTRNYFESLVRALENGLSEAGSKVSGVIAL